MGTRPQGLLRHSPGSPSLLRPNQASGRRFPFRGRGGSSCQSSSHEEVEVFQAGDQIENPVTGEKLVFHETSAENGGKRVVFETIVQPEGFVAAAHVHPYQTECFEIVSGTLGMRRGKEKLELHAGEDAIVEPGTAHKFWNAGEDEVRFLCTVTPALQFE